MSKTLTATETSKTRWAWISKPTTLPRAAHVLVHFFVGTTPLRREIAKFHPQIDKVKKPTTTFSFVQFVELEHIYYRVVTWYIGLRAQSPKYDWDQGSEEKAQGSEEWDQGSQGF